MNSKVSIFISILLIFSPLILFADESGIFAVIIMMIVFVSSFDNILFYLSAKKDIKTLNEVSKLKEEFQKTISVNVRKLELGFSAAKAVLILYFSIYSMYFYNFIDSILLISGIAMFLSLVEFFEKKKKKPKIKLIIFLINIYYIVFISIFITFFLLGKQVW